MYNLGETIPLMRRWWIGGDV